MVESRRREENDTPVGLIGLGLLGRAIATRLLTAGYRVHGHDIRAAAVAEFAESHPRAMPSPPSALFADCDRVVLSLPTHRDVQDVLDAHASELRRGLTIIDTTTGAPAASEAIAGSLAARGIAYLDATVSGSSVRMATGDAVLMVGASGSAWEQHRDLLGCLGRDVFHTGPPGTAAKMKLVSNLVLGLNRAALAEALVFAESLGVDAGAALEIVRAGAGYSRVMDAKGPKMVAGDYAVQARLSQHLKDVELMLAAAGESQLRLPLTQTHRAILQAAVRRGLADADNSAVIEVLRSGDVDDQ